MTGSFTDPQRDALQKLVDTAIGLRVLRGTPTVGGAPDIPDTGKVQEIAAKAAADAVDAFRASQKPWWKFRDRRDTQIATGGLAVLLAFAVVDWALNDTALVRQGLHRLAATETVVEAEIKEVTATSWFQQQMGTALFTQASRRKPEFVALVESVLDNQPIVMFQGRAILGGSDEVAIPNDICRATVGHWFASNPDVLPKALQPPPSVGGANVESYQAMLSAVFSFCPARGFLPRSPSLEVPFWARLHPGEDARADDVRILIQVQALPPERAGPAAAPALPGVPAEGTSYLPYNVWQGAYPLTLEYANARAAGDGSARVVLNSTLTDEGNGFWLATIDDAARKHVPAPARGDNRAYDVLHAITVSFPDIPQDAACGAASRAIPCLREISVRVMVIVNRLEK